MEGHNTVENENSRLLWGSSQNFNEYKYEELNSQIQKEKNEAKKQNKIKRNGLITRLFGGEMDKLSTSETWRKIEWYLQEFQNDPDFLVADGIFDKILTGIINSKDRLKAPLSYQAAALLLANIEKWWSPYRWLSGRENSGFWVKALLGKTHYEQFLRDKQGCINDLNAWKEKEHQIQDVLATCEMDYIINNVSWANWKLKYFWFHDSLLWSWLPNEFANRLESFSKWWFTRSSVKESYEKIIHNDFDLAKYDFERYIKSSRFSLALANLVKMLSLSKNDEQKSESQRCFLICMLSWVLDFNCRMDIKKQVYQWGKTIWFLPWMLAKNSWHSEQVVELLDDFSKWDFSKQVKSFFHEKDLLNWEINMDELVMQVDSWWSVDMMHKFEQYSKSEFLTKKFPVDSVLNKLQKSAKNGNISVDSRLRA